MSSARPNTPQWRKNRLGAAGVNDSTSSYKGMLSMADDNNNEVPVVNASGEKLAKGLEIAKRIGIVVGVIVAGIISAAASGAVTLPPALLGVLNAVLAVLAAAGLASPGLKALPKSEK